MSEWVRLCGMEEAPPAGEAKEIDVQGRTLCLASVAGELRMLDNWCPHRNGPLGQGWVEGNTVVCPWHAWAFDCQTGIAEPPESAAVKVFRVKRESGEVWVDLS